MAGMQPRADKDTRADEQFRDWLERYKRDELDGSIVSRGLSSKYLRDAFMAGQRSRCDCPDCLGENS